MLAMAELCSDDLKSLIGAVAETVIAHEHELTALDQAIGDGDHGLNMKRGFEAVLGDADALSRKPLPDALKAVGMALVMKVGGASGPLYGTLFMEMGKAIAGAPLSRESAAAMLQAGIAGVKARGKSDRGAKTMLDVLIPVHEVLARSAVDGMLSAELSAVAARAAGETVPMKATKGRASYLGERSIGHMDPGARSSALMVAAVCDWLERRG
jgi:dihydroxyacetone kinase-like protein